MHDSSYDARAWSIPVAAPSALHSSSFGQQRMRESKSDKLLERLNLLNQRVCLVRQQLRCLRTQMTGLQDLLHLPDISIQPGDRFGETLLRFRSGPVGISLGDIPADLLERLNKSLVAYEREERGLVAEQTRRRMDRELLRVFAEIKALQPVSKDRSGRFVDRRLRILGKNEARCDGSIGRVGDRGDVAPVIGI